MSDVKVGDRVRIKDRPDWPIPAGYKLANVEGQVVEIVDEPVGYVKVLLDEAQNTTGKDTTTPLVFRAEAVEKL